MEAFDPFLDGWSFVDSFFAVGIAITILVMLYALTLLNRKLHVMVHEMQGLRKDISILSDELELAASANKQKPRASA